MSEEKKSEKKSPVYVVLGARINALRQSARGATPGQDIFYIEVKAGKAGKTHRLATKERELFALALKFAEEGTPVKFSEKADERKHMWLTDFAAA